jgi:hypothetical protein
MNCGSHMFILQQTKYTIHESNQKYFENTQINLGFSSTLSSRLRREMEMARQGGRSQEKRAGVLDVGRAPAGQAPVNFGELRRRTANSGDEQCTSDGERGELERGASSGRGGREERASVPFYREREGRGRDGRGRERDDRDFMAPLMVLSFPARNGEMRNGGRNKRTP